jgi:NAD(P)-dependent dehydrogenase (short-subunit alcohol dehydrogenase family)
MSSELSSETQGSASCRFDGRVALVTGAGRGIGRAYALELARRGASVVVNDRGGPTDGDGASDSGPAHDVVNEIITTGGRALADTGDVADAADTDRMVAAAIDNFGSIDIVIHNAGIVRRADFVDMTGQVLDDVLATSLTGGFNVVRSAWPYLLKQQYGRVVLTSSGGGLFGGARSGNYAAAKMGLIGLALSLAAEGQEHGIHTNVIVPVAKTRLATTLPKNVIERLTPEQVAPVVAWLCHEDCPANGEIYSAAGGRVNRVGIAIGAGVTLDHASVESVRDAFEDIRSMHSATAVLDSPSALSIRLPVPPDRSDM